MFKRLDVARYFGVAVEVVRQLGVRLADRKEAKLLAAVEEVALEGSFFFEAVVDVVKDVEIAIGL